MTDAIRKYSRSGADAIKENEDKMDALGKSAVKNYKEGKVGKAAVDVAKGVGTAAKNMLVTSPRAALDAAGKRIRGDKPTDDEDYMPSDIKDSLQTTKNKKAAENYEATKEYKKGGKVSSASSRGDGCATKGKTKGRMV
jgi:phage terminase small subunit